MKANQFIGVTAVDSKDGKLRATEIHVIPEELRGLDEGHYPMEQPKTTMTNGNLARAGSSAGGANLSITYKGGESEISVGPNVPVTVMSVGTASLLEQGKRATVFGPRDGKGVVTASLLIVESAGSPQPGDSVDSGVCWTGAFAVAPVPARGLRQNVRHAACPEYRRL